MPTAEGREEIAALRMDSPIGVLCLCASREGILLVGKESGIAPLPPAKQEGLAWEMAARCKRELEEYFAGKRKAFDLPLDLKSDSPFSQSVYRAVAKIPYGETRSYREIAEEIGDGKASRAVGMALHRNRILILIPCHRVVSSSGSLGGFALGIEAKKTLLSMEKSTF